MNNNNSILAGVLGVLAIIGIIVVGKFMMSDRCHDGHCEPRHMEQPYRQHNYPQNNYPQRNYPHNGGVNIQVAPPSCPSHYHNKNEFWFGYRDGYNRRSPVDRCPEYMSGYRQGAYDRSRNCHDYFDRNCPSGFQLRVPGFRLDIH